MWLNSNNSSSTFEESTDTNTSNARPKSDVMYQPPAVPEVSCPYAQQEMLPIADACRHNFRPERLNYVHIWFRVRRMNYEQLLWQLMTTGYIKKDRAYDPHNLPFWTVGMRVKVKNHVAMGRVMEAIRARLGAKCPGIRFCLDGFFGMRGFSDIFNAPEACPWMEVSNFSTVISLRLNHGDNVFISVASLAQIADVTEWRRQKALVIKEVQAGTPSPDGKHEASDDKEEESGSIIGKIAYDSKMFGELV